MPDIFDQILKHKTDLETEMEAIVANSRKSLASEYLKQMKTRMDSLKPPPQPKIDFKREVEKVLPKIDIEKELAKILPPPTDLEKLKRELKKEILSSIKIPVVEKPATVIEKTTEKIIEKPTVVEVAKEEERLAKALQARLDQLTKEVSAIREIMPLTGGSGVVGLPTLEGNNGKVLSIVSNQPKWITAPSSGGGHSSTDTYTVSNVTTETSYDATATSIDQLANVLGSLINSLTTAGILGGSGGVSSDVYTPTNVTTERAYDATVTSVDQLANVLGSLIQSLQGAGIIQ